MSIKIKVVIIFGLAILAVIIQLIRGERILKQFFESRINSIVVEKETWQGRTVYFNLQDGLHLVFARQNENKISIGDSVSKDSNTFIYCVHRKNYAGEYDSCVKYDYSQDINSVE